MFVQLRMGEQRRIQAAQETGYLPGEVNASG